VWLSEQAPVAAAAKIDSTGLIAFFQIPGKFAHVAVERSTTDIKRIPCHKVPPDPLEADQPLDSRHQEGSNQNKVNLIHFDCCNHLNTLFRGYDVDNCFTPLENSEAIGNHRASSLTDG
jgi:hypothetical protein